MGTAGNTGARLVSQERERPAEVRELGILTALAPCKWVPLAFMTCWSIVQPLGRRWSSTSGGQSTPPSRRTTSIPEGSTAIGATYTALRSSELSSLIPFAVLPEISRRPVFDSYQQGSHDPARFCVQLFLLSMSSHGLLSGDKIALETLPPRQDLSDQVDPSGPLASDRPPLRKQLAAAHLTSDLCVCVCVLVHVRKSELRAGRILGKATPSTATFTAKKKKSLKIQKALCLGGK